MSHKDYYQVLGVPEDAPQDRLKKAYRDLAKRYHPDRNRGDEEAERRFKEIQEAYDVLGDPAKRSKYDQLRKYGAGGASGVNLEDLFGGAGGGGAGFGGSGFGGSIFDLFERAGMGRRRGPAGPVRGDDLRTEITVPFETAAFGGKVSVRVNRVETCTDCDGAGAKPGTSVEKCSDCRGTGTASESHGAFSFSRPCARCMGRGRVIESPCGRCGGAGTLTRPRELMVSIPAGVADGGTIRLRGEGESGDHGGPSGDLLLTVQIHGHPSFRRDGLDLESDLPIGIAEAALGVTRTVPTLGGDVELKVPAGVQPEARLRLRGRGIRDHGGRQGDHYVRVKVVVPKQLSDEQRELLERFISTE